MLTFLWVMGVLLVLEVLGYVRWMAKDAAPPPRTRGEVAAGLLVDTILVAWIATLLFGGVAT